MKYSKTKMRQNMKARLIATGHRCENCGQPSHPLEAAHLNGKNTQDAYAAENKFFIVCAILHRYEHNLSKNLESHPCVKKYISEHGVNFWPNKLEFTPVGWDFSE